MNSNKKPIKVKRYQDCNYWDENGKCSGYNCCMEAGCPNAKESQPWLFRTREKIFKQISAERDRQDRKWGYPQQNTLCEWGSILAEEVGELCQELNEKNFGRGNTERIIEEAVQVAAVAVSLIEQLAVAEAVSSDFDLFRKAGGAE